VRGICVAGVLFVSGMRDMPGNGPTSAGHRMLCLRGVTASQNQVPLLGRANRSQRRTGSRAEASGSHPEAAFPYATV